MKTLPIRVLIAGPVILILFFFVMTIRGEYPTVREHLSKNILFSGLIKTREDVLGYSEALTIDYFTPPFDSLNQFVASHGRSSLNNLEEYKTYYQRMVKRFPRIAEAHAMLGFIQYYLGEKTQAVDSLAQAVELNPYLSAAYYNLGVIYFEQKKYTQAIFYLIKVLEIPMDTTFKIIKLSKIYQDIIVNPKTHAVTPPQLQKTITDAYKMLVLSCYSLNNFQAVTTIAQRAVESKLDDQEFFHYYAQEERADQLNMNPPTADIRVQIF